MQQGSQCDAYKNDSAMLIRMVISTRGFPSFEPLYHPSHAPFSFSFIPFPVSWFFTFRKYKITKNMEIKREGARRDDLVAVAASNSDHQPTM